MKRVLAACAATVTAVVGLQVAGVGAAVAACQRVIFINPQMTVGEGAGRVVFTVFSGGCAAAGSVSYSTSPGSATPGSDHKPVAGTLSWGAGDFTTRRIIVQIVNDAVAETELEDFTLRLSQPTPNVSLGDVDGHARIADNDNLVAMGVVDDQTCPPITIHTGVPPGEPWLTGEQRVLCDIHEGVIVGLHCDLSASNTITYGTTGGTAEPGVDYVPVSNGQLYVPAGVTRIKLPVEVLRRPANLPTRWFYVEIGGSPRCTFGDPSAKVTIPGPFGSG